APSGSRCTADPSSRRVRPAEKATGLQGRCALPVKRNVTTRRGRVITERHVAIWHPGGPGTGADPERDLGGQSRASVRIARPAAVGERRNEPVPATGHGRDEPRMAIVVLELDPEAPDVAVDDVALGDEIRTPDHVEDLLAGHDLPAPAGEQVEQALFDRAQTDDRLA